MRLDKQAILDAISAYDVADRIGMEIFKRGKNYYIYCPGHLKRMGKIDNKANNCILLEKGYHCFACGAKVNTIDMVSEYMGVSYQEALTMVAELAGGVENFALDFDGEYYRDPTSQPLNNADLDLIFVKKRTERKGALVHVVDTNPGSEFRKNYYIDTLLDRVEEDNDKEKYIYRYGCYDKNISFSLNDLSREDYEAYCFLIFSRAQEAIRKYLMALEAAEDPYILSFFKVLTIDMADKVKTELKLALQRVFEIYELYGKKSGEMLEYDIEEIKKALI